MTLQTILQQIELQIEEANRNNKKPIDITLDRDANEMLFQEAKPMLTGCDHPSFVAKYRNLPIWVDELGEVCVRVNYAD